MAKSIVSRIRNRYRQHQRTRKLRALSHRFQDHAMVPSHWYVSNLKLVQEKVKVPGAIVECGVWKCGMIGGIAAVLGAERSYHLFDSFAGLPPAREIDGERAIAWQADTDNPNYHDNCTAAAEDAAQAMALAGVTNFHIHQGWFKDTLARYKGGLIALLRLDGDWYDSTMACLQALVPQLVPGGILIIDDYYFWDGCTRAVHDYLSSCEATFRIRTYNNQICWLRKP